MRFETGLKRVWLLVMALIAGAVPAWSQCVAPVVPNTVAVSIATGGEVRPGAGSCYGEHAFTIPAGGLFFDTEIGITQPGGGWRDHVVGLLPADTRKLRGEAELALHFFAADVPGAILAERCPVRVGPGARSGRR